MEDQSYLDQPPPTPAASPPRGDFDMSHSLIGPVTPYVRHDPDEDAMPPPLPPAQQQRPAHQPQVRPSAPMTSQGGGYMPAPPPLRPGAPAHGGGLMTASSPMRPPPPVPANAHRYRNPNAHQVNRAYFVPNQQYQMNAQMMQQRPQMANSMAPRASAISPPLNHSNNPPHLHGRFPAPSAYGGAQNHSMAQQQPQMHHPNQQMPNHGMPYHMNPPQRMAQPNQFDQVYHEHQQYIAQQMAHQRTAQMRQNQQQQSHVPQRLNHHDIDTKLVQKHLNQVQAYERALGQIAPHCSRLPESWKNAMNMMGEYKGMVDKMVQSFNKYTTWSMPNTALHDLVRSADDFKNNLQYSISQMHQILQHVPNPPQQQPLPVPNQQPPVSVPQQQPLSMPTLVHQSQEQNAPSTSSFDPPNRQSPPVRPASNSPMISPVSTAPATCTTTKGRTQSSALTKAKEILMRKRRQESSSSASPCTTPSPTVSAIPTPPIERGSLNTPPPPVPSTPEMITVEKKDEVTIVEEVLAEGFIPRIQVKPEPGEIEIVGEVQDSASETVEFMVKQEPKEDNKVIKRSYRYQQHGILKVIGVTAVSVDVYTIVLWLPDSKDISLLMVRNLDLFENLHKKAFQGMSHIDCDVDGNEGKFTLPSALNAVQKITARILDNETVSLSAIFEQFLTLEEAWEEAAIVIQLNPLASVLNTIKRRKSSQVKVDWTEIFLPQDKQKEKHFTKALKKANIPMVNREPRRYHYQQHGILNLINYPGTRSEVELFVVALWLLKNPKQVSLLLVKNVHLFDDARINDFISMQRNIECKVEDEVAEFKLPKSQGKSQKIKSRIFVPDARSSSYNDAKKMHHDFLNFLLRNDETDEAIFIDVEIFQAILRNPERPAGPNAVSNFHLVQAHWENYKIIDERKQEDIKETTLARYLKGEDMTNFYHHKFQRGFQLNIDAIDKRNLPHLFSYYVAVFSEFVVFIYKQNDICKKVMNFLRGLVDPWKVCRCSQTYFCMEGEHSDGSKYKLRLTVISKTPSKEEISDIVLLNQNFVVFRSGKRLQEFEKVITEVSKLYKSDNPTSHLMMRQIKDVAIGRFASFNKDDIFAIVYFSRMDKFEPILGSKLEEHEMPDTYKNGGDEIDVLILNLKLTQGKENIWKKGTSVKMEAILSSGKWHVDLPERPQLQLIPMWLGGMKDATFAHSLSDSKMVLTSVEKLRSLMKRQPKSSELFSEWTCLTYDPKIPTVRTAISLLHRDHVDPVKPVQKPLFSPPSSSEVRSSPSHVRSSTAHFRSSPAYVNSPSPTLSSSPHQRRPSLSPRKADSVAKKASPKKSAALPVASVKTTTTEDLMKQMNILNPESTMEKPLSAREKIKKDFMDFIPCTRTTSTSAASSPSAAAGPSSASGALKNNSPTKAASAAAVKDPIQKKKGFAFKKAFKPGASSAKKSSSVVVGPLKALAKALKETTFKKTEQKDDATPTISIKVKLQKCSQCPYISKSAEELQSHMADKHGNLWPCSRCRRLFETEQQLEEHIRAEHRNGERPQRTLKDDDAEEEAREVCTSNKNEKQESEAKNDDSITAAEDAHQVHNGDSKARPCMVEIHTSLEDVLKTERNRSRSSSPKPSTSSKTTMGTIVLELHDSSQDESSDDEREDSDDQLLDNNVLHETVDVKEEPMDPADEARWTEAARTNVCRVAISTDEVSLANEKLVELDQDRKTTSRLLFERGLPFALSDLEGVLADASSYAKRVKYAEEPIRVEESGRRRHGEQKQCHLCNDTLPNEESLWRHFDANHSGLSLKDGTAFNARKNGQTRPPVRRHPPDQQPVKVNWGHEYTTVTSSDARMINGSPNRNSRKRNAVEASIGAEAVGTGTTNMPCETEAADVPKLKKKKYKCDICGFTSWYGDQALKHGEECQRRMEMR